MKAMRWVLLLVLVPFVVDVAANLATPWVSFRVPHHFALSLNKYVILGAYLLVNVLFIAARLIEAYNRSWKILPEEPLYYAPEPVKFVGSIMFVIIFAPFILIALLSVGVERIVDSMRSSPADAYDPLTARRYPDGYWRR
jgi:hypothetical protein